MFCWLGHGGCGVDHVAQFSNAHDVGIGEWVQLAAMLAGRDAVPIPVLVPLTIHVYEKGPVFPVGIDNVGRADMASERVVAHERNQLLDLRASGEVGDFHISTPVVLPIRYYYLLLSVLFSGLVRHR